MVNIVYMLVVSRNFSYIYWQLQISTSIISSIRTQELNSKLVAKTYIAWKSRLFRNDKTTFVYTSYQIVMHDSRPKNKKSSLKK